MYQNVTEGKFLSFDKKFSNSSEVFHLEPGLHPSVMDVGEAMNTLAQERHDHNEKCITVKVSRKTKKN